MNSEGTQGMNASSTRDWNAKLGWWFALLAGVWLALACGLLAALWFHLFARFSLPWPMVAYLALTVLASAFCFVAYGFDKHRARRNGRRISERTLHAGALAGGWPGALFAQRIFRHKTQKTSFRIVYFVIVLCHLALIGWCIALLTGGGEG